MDLVTISIVLDILLFLLIGYFYLFSRKKGMGKAMMDEGINNLPESISRLVGETREFLKKISDDIEEKKESLEKLLGEVNGENENMKNTIEDARSVLKQLEKGKETWKETAKFEEVEEKKDIIEENLKEEKSGDLYGEVMRLASAGIETEEISRRLNVSRGEIQLILGLKGRK